VRIAVCWVRRPSWVRDSSKGANMDTESTRSTDDRIDAVLRSEPPVPGATLEGWVAFADWKKPSGETVLILQGKPEGNLTQLKGYVHSGLLNMVWGNTGHLA
jgi:hypothetical protein